ncbi:MAG: 2-oxoglutarate dehydrogenase E1 component [Bacteroidales bacterium]|nr:2-oxoglutarate dehydrogenase E1 component [Bacteroidales bacterium]
MDTFSYLNNLDNSVFEEMYENFQANPESVDESWRKFFEGFEFCQVNYKAEKGKSFIIPNEFLVMNLIRGYRERGHLFTKTNPVRTRREYTPTLDLENFDLEKSELNKTFQAGKEIGIGNATLKSIIDNLNETYCQSIGVEYMFIRKPEMVKWLQNKMELTRNRPSFSVKEKSHILTKLAEAVLFEKFIHKKFPGHKSFSLEGCESLIPALETVVSVGKELGNEEFIFGMAHRGRLNVLAHIMHKPYFQIFSEFEGKEYEDEQLLGDVKYHLGFSTDIPADDGSRIHLTMCPNPSHLEAVDPVVEGLSRGLIEKVYKGNTDKVSPVLIHGDASVSGQGIIYEILQMSELPGYTAGGTVHLVVNNQIGFTTNYLEGRSSTYCTDVAKTIQSPIFHVNADDVEAVVYTVKLAMEFRQKFRKDVFIDLLGYRKYGHNESDEPRFTQPILYNAIEKHADPLEIYLNKLETEGSLANIDSEQIHHKIKEKLDQCFEKSKTVEKANIDPFLGSMWQGIRKATANDFLRSPDTGVPEQILRKIGTKLTELPEGIPFFRKIVKLQGDRKAMLDNNKLDWAMAELLAYGSLLVEGIPVRLSGQDSQRGTFSHRHSVLTLEDSEEKYLPLDHLSPDQAKFNVYNSPLSEYGVLGFDYGYALARPDSLTIWEAQFGDFSNGAQVITDQYICSAEEKWRVMNNLVLYLPHGYEGQGPEHSSGRIERFLSICGHLNIQVVNLTTPANLFHALRRQMHRDIRKPLIVFTPKSLLRHPRCVSTIEDLASGGFREVIDDSGVDPKKVTKLVFCSGKIYYDILQKREEIGKEDIALIRIEQIYPFPYEQIREILHRYPMASQYEWVQEEPANMGSWNFIRDIFSDVTLNYVARPPSGTTATGSSQLHKIQQTLLAEKALGMCTCEHTFGSCKLECAI